MIAGFYTYLHRRADDGQVFYVGKGQRRRSHSRYRRTARWLRTVAKHGLAVEIVACFWKSCDAFEHERQLIAEHRAAGSPLCNLTDGGDGPHGYKQTEEQRRKNSELRRGVKQSAETIAKRVAHLVGRPRSAETRAKISASHIGLKIDPAHAARLKEMNTGCVRSPEFKAKIVSALTGRPVSEATREKLSKAHKGRIITAEQRARISATLTGRKPDGVERENFLLWANDPKRRAKHSETMKGRPWSDARRMAQQKRVQS